MSEDLRKFHPEPSNRQERQRREEEQRQKEAEDVRKRDSQCCVFSTSFKPTEWLVSWKFLSWNKSKPVFQKETKPSSGFVLIPDVPCFQRLAEERRLREEEEERQRLEEERTPVLEYLQSMFPSVLSACSINRLGSPQPRNSHHQDYDFLSGVSTDFTSWCGVDPMNLTSCLLQWNF